jgi:hypothetical protein
VLAAGGEVQTLTFVEGYSTTGIIQKACGWGSIGLLSTKQKPLRRCF